MRRAVLLRVTGGRAAVALAALAPQQLFAGQPHASVQTPRAGSQQDASALQQLGIVQQLPIAQQFPAAQQDFTGSAARTEDITSTARKAAEH